MNENMLVSIDDSDLEDVNGGLGFALNVNNKTLAGVSLTRGGLSLTLFGHTISGGISIDLGF